jgi:class 3 adenylate cyclase
MGNEERAVREFRAAKQTFDRLGARLDARTVSADLGEETGADVASRSVIKTFLFTDIVRSTELLSAIGDEAWRHLLRWHDDMIRRLVETHEGSIATSMGDGFLATFDSPTDALACAVAVQRALDSHRRTNGFAPQVRIGFHVAKSMTGEQWSGVGVHTAARIAALAQGGEIVASRETAETAGGALPRSEPERVSLKGFSQPVEVVRISWAS